ncbi:LSU ribosomal protein L18P [Pontibacter ummariensis]|uniref:Large ribosomal subunit protein uL18 n=1 Tax=Pontibacter ummariensis TaxID=1610492 RepID=A0A239AZL8_9BACT|nr:50S ribosomal protein L18 [Pontibacter ummariensis]PRY16212.1 LSU ribosomal protein L18P [Pontibacter ummariensis]SNS01155.1 LSU ribosomal protein L18P [Pontibacter ummariensis]
MSTNKINRRLRIKRSIRNKISGTSERPRLSVFRSNKAIYAQLIDDTTGVTLAAASSVKLDDKTSNIETAGKVGRDIAEKALAKGISSVVFDRSGYLYHGKVKSLAEGAREAGLKF